VRAVREGQRGVGASRCTPPARPLGVVLAVGVALTGYPRLLLPFPVVHALPGLVGHLLFERNLAVGDLRVTRRDPSPL
jgi:hypothetical protein